ncbi:unnamed protein product [Linum trigynum]|uniref:Uncharacterized protein n=1 Tax=Linum trigynum TaxID=586398 RepID=A0AAV2CNL5_9ROSI
MHTSFHHLCCVVPSQALLPLHSKANLRSARGNLCTPPLPDAVLHYMRSNTYFIQVSNDLTVEGESMILPMVQVVVALLFGNMCYVVINVFMNDLNRVRVYGMEKLHNTLLERPKTLNKVSDMSLLNFFG